ncbi:MAG TPA: hypothetical protein VEP73_07850 [Actinomycetota bacterium]|nr:hypothetical protein [Actinomycetota bacterium]
MVDGHEGNSFDFDAGRRGRDASHPEAPDELASGQDVAEGEATGRNRGRPARADEDLFAAFMAAREAALEPGRRLSRRGWAWIAVALVLLFVVSLATGYAAYRSTHRLAGSGQLTAEPAPSVALPG